MTVPLMVLAIGSVLAGWLGVPKLWTVFGENFRGFERWLEPAFASAAVEAAKEGEHSRIDRVDADGPFGGDRDHRHYWWRATSTTTSRDIPDSIEKSLQAAARPALQQVVRGRDLRFPVRERPLQSAAACCWARSTATWWMAASTARAG